MQTPAKVPSLSAHVWPSTCSNIPPSRNVDPWNLARENGCWPFFLWGGAWFLSVGPVIPCYLSGRGGVMELSQHWPRWTRPRKRRWQLDWYVSSSTWWIGWNLCLSIFWSWIFCNVEETNLTRKLRMHGPNMRTRNSKTPVEMMGEIHGPSHSRRHWKNCPRNNPHAFILVRPPRILMLFLMTCRFSSA